MINDNVNAWGEQQIYKKCCSCIIMSGITLIPKITEKNQNDFIVDEYHSFLANALYGYLFESLFLRDIEEKYLSTTGLQGFFAKGVLNLMGIDTSTKTGNRGLYKGKDVNEVANDLINCSDIRINNIGRILLSAKYL